MVGFTRDFAVELFDVREMFEMRAFRRFASEPLSADDRTRLDQLQEEHLALIADIDNDFLSFPRLDERFHEMFLSRMNNRFADDFFELVSLIFHYHYRWRKVDERDRNLAAAREHLRVIRALRAGNQAVAERAFAQHLQTARKTLLKSVTWS